MKKITLFSVILLFTGMNMVMAQLAKVNHIPCFNYPLTEQYAAFVESGSGSGGESREQRDMDVEVNTTTDATSSIFATVWVVNVNSTEVLGPFTVVANGPTLQVPLSGGKWGVIVNCKWDVYISVWTSHKDEP
jgi:hypothetical protein